LSRDERLGRLVDGIEKPVLECELGDEDEEEEPNEADEVNTDGTDDDEEEEDDEEDEEDDDVAIGFAFRP